MNEPITPPPPPDYLSLCHVIGLRYLLAGDLESREHLDRLSERIQTINWNDPEFVRFTEEMRADLVKLTPEQEEQSQPRLLAVLNAMRERLADQEEIGRQNVKFLKEQITKIAAVTAAFSDLELRAEKNNQRIRSMVELVEKMRDRLETLGDDVSKFQLPEVP